MRSYVLPVLVNTRSTHRVGGLLKSAQYLTMVCSKGYQPHCSLSRLVQVNSLQMQFLAQKPESDMGCNTQDRVSNMDDTFYIDVYYLDECVICHT